MTPVSSRPPRARLAALRTGVVLIAALVSAVEPAPARADDVRIDSAVDVQIEVTLTALQSNIYGDVSVLIPSAVTCTNNVTHESLSTTLPALLKAHVTEPAAFEHMYSMLLSAHLARRAVKLQMTGYRRANGQTFCSIYRVTLL